MSKIHETLESAQADETNGKTRSGETAPWVLKSVTVTRTIPAGTVLYQRQAEGNGDVAIAQIMKHLGVVSETVGGKKGSAAAILAALVAENEALKKRLAEVQPTEV